MPEESAVVADNSPVPALLTDNTEGQYGKGTISQIAWSPDGKFIVAGGSAGIRFYTSDTLEEIRFIPTDFLITVSLLAPMGNCSRVVVLIKASLVELIGVDSARGGARIILSNFGMWRLAICRQRSKLDLAM